MEELFYELVYLPELCMEENFEVEVALVDAEEYLIDDGKGSWRRRRWSIEDRKLVDVFETRLFRKPADFLELIPEEMTEFTARDLSETLKLTPRLGQKMIYSLRHMGAVRQAGKRGRANLYTRAM